MKCPKCQSKRKVKSGFTAGKQRYKCKECSCNYTQSHKKGKPEIMKALAYVLYLEGLGFRAIARILKVSNVSVLRWIRTLADKMQPQTEEKIPNHFRVIEIDEMWHYIGKKKEKSGSGWLLIEIPEKFLRGKSVVVERNHSEDCWQKYHT